MMTMTIYKNAHPYAELPLNVEKVETIQKCSDCNGTGQRHFDRRHEAKCIKCRGIGWCQSKFNEWRSQAKEHSDAIVIAKKNGWDHQALNRALSTARRYCYYYQKMIACLKRGYTIIPGVWPLTSVGERTDAKKPRVEYKYHQSNVANAAPKQLPEGEGRYVGNVTVRTLFLGDEKHYYADGFVEGLDFPAFAAKPRLMRAAEKAAEERIFDTIGVTDQRADPLLVGVIRGPNYRECHFLIAWWLDTRAL